MRLMPWLPMSEETIRSFAKDFYEEYKAFVQAEIEIENKLSENNVE